MMTRGIFLVLMLAVWPACRRDGRGPRDKDLRDEASTEHVPAGEALRGGSGTCYSPESSSAVSVSQIASDLERRGIKSAEAMLDYFAEEPLYQPFLDNAILERRSDALHGEDVNDAFPRIVMRNGNVTMHLIGEYDNPGRHLVEFAEFLPDENRFAFSIVNLLLQGRSEFFLADINKKIDISPALQALHSAKVGAFGNCNACHQTRDGSLLPIWSPSSSLFKVFGGGDDAIKGDTDERIAYQSYLETKSDPIKGRVYRHIALDSREDDDQTLHFTSRPNRRFTEHVFAMIRARLAGEIREIAGYDQLKFAIAGAFLGCDGIPDFLPPKIRQAHEKELLASVPEHRVIPLDLVTREDRDVASALAKSSKGDWTTLTPAGTLVVAEKELLKVSSDPVAALSGWPLLSNRALSFFASRRMTKNGLEAPARAGEADFTEVEFVRALGALRYLLDAKIPGGIAPFQELRTSDEFQFNRGRFMTSYRIDGGLSGLRLVFSCHLRDQDFDARSVIETTIDSLSSPSHDVSRRACDELKSKSLEALGGD